MQPTELDTQRAIDGAVSSGKGLDQIETEILSRCGDADQRDALWLYAWGYLERLAEGYPPIVAETEEEFELVCS